MTTNPKTALSRFANLAKSIPENWPGECILRFGRRNDGSIHLDYYGITDASGGLTIDEWRADGIAIERLITELDG